MATLRHQHQHTKRDHFGRRHLLPSLEFFEALSVQPQYAFRLTSLRWRLPTVHGECGKPFGWVREI